MPDGQADRSSGFASGANLAHADARRRGDETSSATAILHVVLYKDAGTLGKFEVPGADTPVTVAGRPVDVTFNVTGAVAGTPLPPGITTPEQTAKVVE